jgi:hypothetical protein
MNATLRLLARAIAIAMNLVALFLELNVEVQSRIHHLTVDWSWAARVGELAPLFALVAIFWPVPSSGKEQSK